jgi:hypothetical protein
VVVGGGGGGTIPLIFAPEVFDKSIHSKKIKGIKSPREAGSSRP